MTELFKCEHSTLELKLGKICRIKNGETFSPTEQTGDQGLL